MPSVQQHAAGSRGPARARSEHEVADAAIALADAGGLGAVTMRATASGLGTSAAALYRYVASRDELLELMVDRVLESWSPPDPDGDTAARLVALARSQVAVLRRHPWLVDAMPVVRPGPAAILMLETGLDTLAPVPGDGAVKLEALAMITGVAALFARASVEPSAKTMEALSGAAATHPRLAAAFAEPGTATPPDELLARTVGALASGLLPGFDRSAY